MAYSIHIERRDDSGHSVPIALSEWIEVIGGVANVRLRSGDFHAVNPVTGEHFTIVGSGGDVEFFDVESEEWQPGFFWTYRGSAEFPASASVLLPIAKELSVKLNARLIGDEGEVYE